MKKRRALRFFWLGILCCLYLWGVAAAVQAQPQGDVAMPANSNEAGQHTEKKVITVPLRLEMIGMDIEKKGTYAITLGFQPSIASVQEFENVLRSDFTGEIDVFLNGKLHKTIRYEDYTAFAPAPVGGGYGPVYLFDVDAVPLGGGRQCDLYPRIRANVPCSYSFAIARQPQSYGDTVKGFFQSSPKEHRRVSGQPVAAKPELQAVAQVERIDIAIEKKGRYGVEIGFRKPEQQKFTDFYRIFHADFAGTIEIWRNSKLHTSLNYDTDSIAIGSAGYGAAFEGLAYSVDGIDVGWYGFVPRIMSIKDGTFGFNIKRAYMTK